MTENAQVSNLPDGNKPNGNPEPAVFDSENFFEDLESSINGGIIDPQPDLDPEPKQAKSADNKAQPVQNGSDTGQSDIENLQQRYSDSSNEGKRLSEENKLLKSQIKATEPYMPILDAMREDPNLITHVRGYFEGGGQAPVSMKERLSLGEDFVFDADDAMSDSNSDSSKLLQATIDGVVQKRLNDALAVQRKENARQSQEAEFRAKHNMSDEEWKEFVQFAKGKSLQLEDIWYLKNKGKAEQNISQSANSQVAQQMAKTQERPQSLATAGSHDQPEISAEDKVFNAIASIDTELEEAFGGID